MSKIETIVNAELNAQIRIMKDVNGEILFSGKDVATALEYADTDQAIRVHVDKEDIRYIRLTFAAMNSGTGTPYNSRGGTVAAFVNESGLYSLIFGSTKKEAKKFKRWVTSDVLPKIRKFGYYRYENRPKKDFAALIESISTNRDKETQHVVTAEDIYDVIYLAQMMEEGFDLDKDIARLVAINMANAKFGCFDELRQAVIDRMSNPQTLLAISDEEPKED